MKILYANGCSMTHGDELPKETREKMVWPTILGQHIDADVIINEGLPGGSNERILRRTLKYIAKYINDDRNIEDLTVAIAWTLISRREHGDIRYKTQPEYNFYRSFLPSFVYPDDDVMKKMHKLYYSCYETDRHSETLFVNQVILLQNTLQKYGIKYIFSYGLRQSLGSIGTEYEDEIAISKKLIDTNNFYEYELGSSFSHYAALNGCPMGPFGHPLELGHKMWGEEMAKFYKTIY